MSDNQPDMPQDPHAKACDEVMSHLSDLLAVGGIPGGGYISAYVTVVETMNDQGGSDIYLLFSDGRTTMLTGLLTCGSMMVAKNA